MTFKTEKRKIFKIWNNSISNQFQINILSDNDGMILSQINQLNDTDMVYNNIINLSSDWLAPDITVRNKGEESELIWKSFKEYSIEINGISKNLIPYIESKISYRLGDSQISIPIPDAIGEPGTPFDEEAILEINNVVEIKDVLDGFRRNIIYKSSVFLQDGDGLPEELQFKFFINLFNPIYYQST